MTPMRKIHAQDLIAVLNRREIDRHISLRTAVWLHVGVVCTKQLFRTVDRSLLDYVSPFTPAVVTFTRIAFCILVCEHRASSLEHGLAHEILRGNEFEAIGLPRYLVVDGAGDDWID